MASVAVALKPYPAEEPVIISLNSELYLMKCQVLLLGVENAALRGQIARFQALADDIAAHSVRSVCA